MAIAWIVNDATGTIYGIVRSKSLLPANKDTGVYEAYDPGNYADHYVYASTQQGGTGLRFIAFDDALLPDFCFVDWKMQVGSTAAETDVSFGVSSQTQLETDFADGGRLDLAIDQIASDSDDAATQATAVNARLPATPAATGDAMALTSSERTTLAAAVWNALTTGMATAGSIGKWLLETIGAVSLGTGARTVTVTVTDGTNAIEDATVRVTNGATTHVGKTNISGTIAFSLDDATWTVAITKSNCSFTPTTLIISDNTSHTYTMMADSFPESDPGLVTGYLYAYSEMGTIETGVVIELQLIGVAGSGHSFDQATRTGTSNAQGLVSFANLSVGASYKLRRSTTGKWKNITIESDAVSPLALPNIFGTDT